MFIKLYFITLPVLLLLDAVWLALIAKNFYAKQIGFLMKPDFNWAAALVFYLLFTAGLVTFVLIPSVEKNSFSHALLFGAFFGLVAYAAYDLTNLATVKNWPILVTVVDLAWGAVVSALVCAIAFLIFGKINL